MARIMVVEDDEASRETLLKYLRYRGYDALSASNGKEALEKLGATHVDIVLMDISMPIMDGIEATRIIREKSLPVVIIVLTAFSDEETMKKAIKAGADDFIPKRDLPKKLCNTLS